MDECLGLRYDSDVGIGILVFDMEFPLSRSV